MTEELLDPHEPAPAGENVLRGPHIIQSFDYENPEPGDILHPLWCLPPDQCPLLDHLMINLMPPEIFDNPGFYVVLPFPGPSWTFIEMHYEVPEEFRMCVRAIVDIHLPGDHPSGDPNTW